MRIAMFLVLVGCGGAREPSSTTASGSASPVAKLVIPPTGVAALPADHTICKSHADCTLVAFGCGDETPVNRAHHATVKQAYEAAGRIPGAIDDACGPGIGGTWDSAPGECVAARCELPVAMFAMPQVGPFTPLPWSYTQCNADADCEMVSNDCCDPTPANRLHANLLRRTFQKAGRICTLSNAQCGPDHRDSWDGVAGACLNHTCTIPLPRFAIPSTGPITLPNDYLQCTRDDECTFASRGCCDTTPVRRTHLAALTRQLADSGRPHCPVKTACGPGTDGTWANTDGACVAGMCATPKPPSLTIPSAGPITLPADHTACLSDAECVLVSLGCAHETPVNRAHEADTRKALVASGRPAGPVRDACGPGRSGSWDGTPSACVAKRCDFPLAMFKLPKTGVVALPETYRTCAADAECTVVSRGCDDATGVNRTYASLVDRALEASGRPYRAPKDACGPGPSATMHGVAGSCRDRICVVPKWPR
jgi:hypothetical protein